MRRLRGHGARGHGARGHGVRGGGDSLPYDAIVGLNPDFFVQFKYPVYAGQQVLFRDELCTSPVTDAGNHTIGGVKNPFTDEIILTQANAAAKPLWGGPNVGAIFDAIDDYLDGVSGFPSGDVSVFASVTGQALSQARRWVVTGSNAGGVRQGLYFNSIYNASVFDDGTRVGSSVDNANARSIFGAKYLNGTDSVSLNEDGSATNAGPMPSTPNTGNLLVGCRTPSSELLDIPLNWIALFNRDTTPVEEAVLWGTP